MDGDLTGVQRISHGYVVFKLSFLRNWMRFMRQFDEWVTQIKKNGTYMSIEIVWSPENRCSIHTPPAGLVLGIDMGVSGVG
jgi:hypothetical protein